MVEEMPTRSQANRLMKALHGPTVDKNNNLDYSSKDPKDYTAKEISGTFDQWYRGDSDADELIGGDTGDEEGSQSDFSGYDWEEMSDSQLAELDPETRKQAEFLRALAKDTEFFKTDMTKEEKNATTSSDEELGTSNFFDHRTEL
jgi:hypothetical protein